MTTMNASHELGSGYSCKQCGGASPIGVGYADRTIAPELSATLTACACGYSQKPTK